MAIIEKVGSEGNINNNVNTKIKSNKVRNNKSIAFIRDRSKFFIQLK